MATRHVILSCALVALVASAAAQGTAASSTAEVEAKAHAAAQLRVMIEAAPRLPLVQTDLEIQLPEGEQLGKVSWIARDPKSGIVWLIQRGEKAPPVIAFDPQGRVVHSFGQGLYTIPHSIRLDSEGNVWTVDAGSSRVIKYTPAGQELLRIEIGGQPDIPSPFKGATDISLAAGGRIFVSDGYGNARVVEYTATGKKVREWGAHGIGPGEFHLVHSIVLDENGVLYVADRENGRIEKFDLEGKLVGEIPNLGRTYSLELGPEGTLWASMAPLNAPTGAPGWIVKLDRRTGKVLGYVPVTGQGGLHTVELDGEGHPMTAIDNRVVVFRP